MMVEAFNLHYAGFILVVLSCLATKHIALSKSIHEDSVYTLYTNGTCNAHHQVKLEHKSVSITLGDAGKDGSSRCVRVVEISDKVQGVQIDFSRKHELECTEMVTVKDASCEQSSDCPKIQLTCKDDTDEDDDDDSDSDSKDDEPEYWSNVRSLSVEYSRESDTDEESSADFTITISPIFASAKTARSAIKKIAKWGIILIVIGVVVVLLCIVGIPVLICCGCCSAFGKSRNRAPGPVVYHTPPQASYQPPPPYYGHR